MEKRRERRHPRRLAVRFGENDFTRSGFTRDVSGTGLFVVSSYLPALDSRIHLQLVLGPDSFLCLEARVRRHKLVPAALRQHEHGGFGARFLTPAEVMAELVPQATARRFAVAYESPAALQQSLDQELRFGGLMVRTEHVLPRDTAVTVELQLNFLGRSLSFGAHVAQALPGGLAVVFDDLPIVKGTLEPLARLPGRQAT